MLLLRGGKFVVGLHQMLLQQRQQLPLLWCCTLQAAVTHVTRHTSHVTHHTSHVTRHTPASFQVPIDSVEALHFGCPWPVPRPTARAAFAYAAAHLKFYQLLACAGEAARAAAAAAAAVAAAAAAADA